MNENEKPAIGSSEAAVLTVVELIARGANMSEQHLAYWLDLYYQVRSRHEVEHSLTLDDMVIKTEWPDPVMALLDELEKKIDELEARIQDLVNELAMQRVKVPSPDAVDATTYAAALMAKHTDALPGGGPDGDKTWKDICAEAIGPSRKSAPLKSTDEKPAEEPKAEPAPSSRKRAPMTAGEKRKLQNAQKEKDRITKDSDRDFKRATLWKLMKARNGGLTIGTIVANSEGKLTENTVLDILNAVPRSEADYRALDAALDKCAEIE